MKESARYGPDEKAVFEANCAKSWTRPLRFITRMENLSLRQHRAAIFANKMQNVA